MMTLEKLDLLKLFPIPFVMLLFDLGFYHYGYLYFL